MAETWTDRVRADFHRHCSVYWANLARLTGLLVVLNISFFFLTELVKMGYFYTYYSLGALAAVYLALLVPLGLTQRLWFYLLAVGLQIVAIYFLAVSIWYWVQYEGGRMAMPL